MAISWADFGKVDMRVGRIISAEDSPKARKPSYKITIDFGSEIGVKNTPAQLTKLCRKEDLIGKQVIAVVNLPPKQVADFSSEVLMLGVMCDGGVVLLQPERESPLGKMIA